MKGVFVGVLFLLFAGEAIGARPCGRIQPKYRVEGFPNHFFSNS